MDTDQVIRDLNRRFAAPLPTLIALCSIVLGRPAVGNLAILGDITISGTMIKVDELALRHWGLNRKRISRKAWRRVAMQEMEEFFALNAYTN